MNRAGRWLAAVAMAAVGGWGCDSPSNPQEGNARSFPGTTLRVAVAGDPRALDAVRAWRTTWERDTGGKVVVADEEAGPDELKAADVILFAGDRMGALADRQALAILVDSAVRPPIAPGKDDAAPDPLAFQDIVPAYRELVTKYGEQRLGLPLGGSGLVLAYRKDAFESPANKAAAKEKGLALAPPRTWGDLDALARFFHGRDWDGDGSPESGIAAALGADEEGVGDAILLARGASLGQHPDHYALLFNPDTLEPRIADPPFVEAMSAIANWKGSAPPGAEGFDAEAARAAFRSGEVALLIDRAEKAHRWTDPKAPASVGVAALPGSPRVYEPDRKVWQDAPGGLHRVAYLPHGGGWMVGMSAAVGGATKKAALDFVRALAGPETVRSVQSEPAFPMLPTRNGQLGSGPPDPRSTLGVDSRGWGIAVAQTMTAPRVVPGLRIPGTDRYLADLAKARVAAIAGTPAESALRDAARSWSATSEELGTARQLWHYRRSLNKLVTDPQPPGRSGGTEN